MENLAKIIGTIAKLNKRCTVRIIPDKICFHQNELVKDQAHKLWCELVALQYFDDFRMEGYSEEHNDIFFDLNCEEMSRGFKAAATSAAKQLKLRLTKKGNNPYLTFDLKLPSNAAANRILTHEVPINIIHPRNWSEYQEPPVPDFDVSIYFPPVKSVERIIAGMKNVGNYISLAANYDKQLEIVLETDSTSICTRFKDLGHPVWTDESSQQVDQRNKAEFYRVRIDAKTLHHFLRALQITCAKLICNIVQRRVLHFYLSTDTEDLEFQYFIPAVAL